MRNISIIISILLLHACTKSGSKILVPDLPPNDTDINHSIFAKGADVSWLTKMEASGVKFYNRAGTQRDLILVLKELGINSLRLRVWVDPADGYNSTADVVAKAIRATNAGMRVMIDFHYSDTWADPGHQLKPVAWTNQDINGLQTSVFNHTVAVMNALKAKGISPDWVQVGNEINNGMLWPEGKAGTNMANLAKLVNAGYTAVKSVSDSTKVIVHISNGDDNGLFRWIFDGLQNNGAKWDVIGMSLYPSTSNWSHLNAQCLANMKDMIARYNKPVMITEAGMSWTEPEGCRGFLEDLIAKTRSLDNNMGVGVFYWEPEAYNNWEGYSLGAFDNSGKPTVALDAFK